jgi:hypothetical protein
MAAGDYAKLIDAGTTSGVGGVLFTDRRKFYIDPNIYSELWTSVTPFLSGLMSKAGSRRDLADPLFKMFEHRNPWQKQECVTTTAATIGNDDNSDALTVGSIVGMSTGIASAADNSYLGLVFEVWDSTKTTKRGVVFVTATAANTLTVKNMGTTSITTVSGDYLVLIGHQHGEAKEAPDAWADELLVVWNSTGIIRVPVDISGTLYQASLRGANKELERLRKQKMQQHKLYTEKLFLRGQSVLGTNMDASGTFADNWRTDADSRKVRSAMGLITAIETYGNTSGEYQNVFDNTAGMDFSDWVDITEKLWQYLPDSGVKDFYCGPRALSYWSKIDNQGKLRTGFDIKLSDMKSDELGVYFKYLETPFGLSRLIFTPSLKREYQNYMISATPENMFHAVYRPLRYFTNIKTDNNYDGIKDEYFSDEGIGISLIESHSIVKTPVS